MRRMMSFVFTAVMVAGAMNAAAQSPEQKAVVAMVHQFADGFNKGDTKSALAACASPASIIDEFPPYRWEGQNACADWARDYDADAKKNGITGGVVTLGKPWHVDISGDRAYAVFPVRYTFKQKGKPMVEPASVLTASLQKGANGWRITSWSWSKH